MNIDVRQIVVTQVYVAMLSVIYLLEIVKYWEYVGYSGEFTYIKAIYVSLLTVILSIFAPQKIDSRGLLLTVLNYLYFFPSIVYSVYSAASAHHYISLLMVVTATYVLSCIPTRPIAIASLTYRQMMFVVLSAMTLAIALQAAFGGLAYFNLDIERVYEFRTVAAEELPGIFGYLSSNIASVVVPLSLVLAIKLRHRYFALFAIAGTILLFGMTHHKSVLFGPFFVLALYLWFSRVKSPLAIGFIFLAIPCIALLEMAYMRYGAETEDLAYVTSLIVRRVFFVPTLLDGIFVEYFSNNIKYYWTWSRIGPWVGENPYGVAPPFLIGIEYFSDPDTSANIGVIGSGYANAGLIGVAVYSIFAGALISLLNAYGKRIGHALVAATSLTTVFYIMTTTDLLTSILSHGLLLMLALFAMFRYPTATAPSERHLLHDRTLHNRSPAG